MKISERIALLKAGYSKDEISAMIAEEAAEAKAAPAEESAPVSDAYAEAITALAGEVKKLKEGIQLNNINNTEIEKPRASIDDALAILGGVINPDFNKKEE